MVGSALLSAFCIFVPFPEAAANAPAPLGPEEADRLVEERMAERRTMEKAERLRLLGQKASLEVVSRKAASFSKNLVFRRISRPGDSVFKELPTIQPRRKSATALPPGALAPTRNIFLSAVVFDHAYSEVFYYCEDGRRLRIVSNIDFNLLARIGWFSDETALWSLIMIIENVDTEAETEIAAKAAEFGSVYHPRERPDPSLFDSVEPGYVVFAENEETVPDSLFVEMDALHRHYVANEEKLRVLFQRREAKREALARWRERNPPVEQDTIINYWPIRSNAISNQP
jgi:hypothetical protein